ncbi:MAG: OmpA family protein [Ignavibacteriaceae bacterium]|nr:OmpA family protein [Ignavibacteriaceae bacterium]
MHKITRLTLMFIILLLALPQFAQEKPSFGLQFNFLYPSNDFPIKNTYKFSYTAKALCRFDLSDNFKGQVGAGYGGYAGLDYDQHYYKTSLVPIDFKLLWMFSHTPVKPYLFAGLGGVYYKVKFKPTSVSPKSVDDQGIAGSLEGGIGIQLGPIDLNAGVGYTSTDNLNFYRDGAAFDAYYFVGVAVLLGGGYVDSDNDGVPDYMDKCPGTPAGVKVDMFGCPLDSDGDGVPDYLDNCPNTPHGVAVDSHGCPLDADGDGVPDYLDKCPNTPAGVKVDAEGCPLDSDGDGVPDYLDKCPNTPKGVAVDKDGCPLDSDGDGVPDYLDKCPNTPKGTKVDANGCPVMKEEFKHFKLSGDANFNSGKSVLLPAAYPVLDKLADAMVSNPNYKWSVEGYTDSKGKDASNIKLSEKRAQAVVDYLVSKGVNKNVFTIKGFGKANPVADNKTEEGRAKNRRVEIKIIN